MYEELPSEFRWLAAELLDTGRQFNEALGRYAMIRQGFHKVPILRPRRAALLTFESQLYVLGIFNALALDHGFTQNPLEDLNFTAAFETIYRLYDSIDPDGELVDACDDRIRTYVKLLRLPGSQAGPRLSNYLRQLYYHAEQAESIFLWKLGIDSIIIADITVEIAFADALAKADQEIVTHLFRRRGGTLLELLRIAHETISRWRNE